MERIVIIMGSKSDTEFVKKIEETIKKFEVEYITEVASAHKTPLKVLDILRKYENKDVVFITVAGRSNALSGFVDANTHHPVIACPPYSDKFCGFDILSTLRMPSGVAPLTILEPDSAALAAIKILSLNDKKIKEKVLKYQSDMK